MVKRSKAITQITKTAQNQNIIDIKLVTIEHPKMYRKLCRKLYRLKRFPKYMVQANILLVLYIVK